MKIVGIGAQIAQGKTVLAKYLTNKMDKWYNRSLATPVKQIFMDNFDVDQDFIEEWKRKDVPPPGFDLPIRDCLILIGDNFRKMLSSVWISKCFKDQVSNFIIDDMRYINETNYIRNNGGHTILLWRPSFENSIQNDSEQQFMPFVNKLKQLNFDGVIPKGLNIPFDLWIRNDGTLGDLYEKADKIIIPYINSVYEN